jgi:P27 family predicted phage terminase small subunit
MGRRGPPPTPTQVLAERGSWRAKLNPTERTPKSGAPRPPKGLSTEAAAEWKRVAAALAPTRVLTSADRSALLMYVQAWSHMQEAAAQIAKDGTVIVLPNAFPTQNPYLKVFNESHRQCLRMLQEFGLTPSARARIPAGGAGDDKAGELQF